VTKPISLTATAGAVHFVGEGEYLFSLTPDVALEIAVDLPRFSALARLLAGETLEVDDMASTLTQLGYVWQSSLGNSAVGQWLQSDSDPVTPAESFDRSTRRVFAEVVCGAVGPVL